MDTFKKNNHLAERLDAIFSNFQSGYAASRELSSATKGVERELFVACLLREVFPPHFRFQSGDITDSKGSRSGQVDIVLEHARGFSFPIIPNGPRLYLSENVAAVIEVKSDVRAQWNDVKSTAKKVKALSRVFALHHAKAMLESGCAVNGDREAYVQTIEQKIKESAKRINLKIPVYAVGFKGWKCKDTIDKNLVDSYVDGVFVIDEKLYVGPNGFSQNTKSMLLFLEQLEIDFNKSVDQEGPTIYYHV